MFARHLEVNEFLDIMMVTPKKIWKQVICLDNGIAGIVYGFLDQGNFLLFGSVFIHPNKKKKKSKNNGFFMNCTKNFIQN